MQMSGALRHLLLAGTCLCVYGTPVPLPSFTPTQDSGCDGKCASSVKTATSTQTVDVKSEPSDTEHVTGLLLNEGAGGGAGPHGRPEGIAPVMQTANGDSLDGRSGPSEAGGEAWSQRSKAKRVGSSSEIGDAERQSESTEDKAVISEQKSASTGGKKQLDVDTGISRLITGGFLASSIAPPQLETSYSQKSKQVVVDSTRIPDGRDPLKDKDPETSSLSFTDPRNPSAGVQRLTSHTPIPPSVFVSPRTSTPLTIWGHDGATISSPPDPLLPEIGPNLMSREDGPESLWTEAARSGGGESKNLEMHN